MTSNLRGDGVSRTIEKNRKKVRPADRGKSRGFSDWTPTPRENFKCCVCGKRKISVPRAIGGTCVLCVLKLREARRQVHGEAKSRSKQVEVH